MNMNKAHRVVGTTHTHTHTHTVPTVYIVNLGLANSVDI